MGMPEFGFISVITPVYNAAEFVTRAVESALAQPEVAEVLLIEDGSPDDSLAVCQALAEQYDRVRLLRHPGGENRGAGASRNLGMQNASCEYIAFLDADDYYLPERFSIAKQVFESEPTCEGVYEAIGIHIENDEAIEKWEKLNRHSPCELITMTGSAAPDRLGVALINGDLGSYSLDGLVIKKAVLKKSGTMNGKLHLHQDTEWMIRCALVANLYPGSLDRPVSRCGIHERNRFFAPCSAMREYRNRMKMWMSLFRWTKEHASQDVVGLVARRIVQYNRSQKYFNNFPRHLFPSRLIWFTRLLRLVRNPEVVMCALKRDQ